ncbi:MAG: STAS domain-containing protein [Cyanobacteriota bacterium]
MAEKIFKIFKKEDSLLVKLPNSDFDSRFSFCYKQTIKQILAKHNCKALILDFSNIDMIDKDGLASLIYTLKIACSKGITLLTCCFNDNIIEAYDHSGLKSIIDFAKSIKEAFIMAEGMLELRQMEDHMSRLMGNIFGYPLEENFGLTEEEVSKIKSKIFEHRRLSQIKLQ